ncbi:hypothetical protein TIFTF001_023118 [Ficus carica]|uniref:Uncharacterized protein n=1 Tax=Ficus carica TaxID=3494 RepID=A0AA88AWJ8_FICCA|nr:hypothetical protein TIFTF001_023118 [Ficus carica]
MRKTFLTLFLLFLGFSRLLSSAAVPTTRSLWSVEEYSSLGVLQKQSSLEMFGKEEEEKKRMDLENTLDYPGTGANKNHDPKTPGTS